MWGGGLCEAPPTRRESVPSASLSIVQPQPGSWPQRGGRPGAAGPRASLHTLSLFLRPRAWCGTVTSCSAAGDGLLPQKALWAQGCGGVRLPLPGKVSLGTPATPTPHPHPRPLGSLLPVLSLEDSDCSALVPVPLAPQGPVGSVLRTRCPHPALHLPRPAPESRAGPPALSSEVT